MLIFLFSLFGCLCYFFSSRCDTIGGYPARMRLPFLAPSSRLDYDGDGSAAATQGASLPAASSTQSLGRGHAPTKATGGGGGATTAGGASVAAATPPDDSSHKDAALLLHQRAVSAAKGAVVLLFALPERRLGGDDTCVAPTPFVKRFCAYEHCTPLRTLLKRYVKRQLWKYGHCNHPCDTCNALCIF